MLRLKTKSVVVPAVMAASVLAGCSSTPESSEGGVNLSPVTCAVIGALAGGAVGSIEDSEAAVGGALVAGAVGAMLCADKAEQEAPAPLDSDADGVEDYYDDCPATPAGVQVDNVGCPLDEDADGVADYQDQCLGSPAGTQVDAKGCLKEVEPVVVKQYCEEWVVLEDGDVVGYRPVQFAIDSSDIATADRPELDCIAGAQQQQKDRLLIEGYTDSVGDSAYNQALSERRAESVRQYLIDQGASVEVLETVGYGEQHPASSNETKEGRTGNRRVEFKILE